jgi:hypothetical protein
MIRSKLHVTFLHFCKVHENLSFCQYAPALFQGRLCGNSIFACRQVNNQYLREMTRYLLPALLLLISMVVAPALAEPPAPVVRQCFTFLFDSPQYMDPADSVLTETRTRLISLIKDSLPYRPRVYLVNEEEAFTRLLGTKFPDWGAAAAIPTRELIVIKSPDHFNLQKSLPELLAHEYTHLVMAHRTGFNEPPRWLDEGMAMHLSAEWGWSNNVAMGSAAVFGRFLSLEEIDRVNRFTEGKARLAYAQSYLAVNYLFTEYGGEAVNLLLDRIQAGDSLDDALMASVGSRHSEFELEFHEYLTGRYNIVSLFADMTFLFIGLAVVVVIGAFLKYRKRREYFKKWEQEEKLHSTDFDYGDPDNPERTDDDEPWRS